MQYRTASIVGQDQCLTFLPDADYFQVDVAGRKSHSVSLPQECHTTLWVGITLTWLVQAKEANLTRGGQVRELLKAGSVYPESVKLVALLLRF